MKSWNDVIGELASTSTANGLFPMKPMGVKSLIGSYESDLKRYAFVTSAAVVPR